MNVAIVHYHMGPGGVAQVIEAASQALATACIRHVILTGDVSPSDWVVSSRTKHRRIPGLEYLPTPGDHTAESLTESLRVAATAALGSPRWSVAGGLLMMAPALSAGDVAPGTSTGRGPIVSASILSFAFTPGVPPSGPNGMTMRGVLGEKLISVPLGSMRLPLMIQL